MKKRFAFVLMMALAVCGCQTGELDVCDSESKVFTATVEEGTKTSMNENGNVLWKKGDQVSVYAGNTLNKQYQVTDDSDGKTSGTLLSVSDLGLTAVTQIDCNVAYYPYSEENILKKPDGGYIVVIPALPAVQNYAEDSFGNGAFPMAAVTSSVSETNLKFRNVLGGVKLQLKGTAKIASVSITGNSDEILCGPGEVTVSNTENPAISLTDETARTVTLDCGDGVQLNEETATSFVIALPPMTMESGFTVNVTDTDGGRMAIRTTKSQTVKRSDLLRMPAVTYEATNYSKPLTVTAIEGTTVIMAKQGKPASVSIEYRIGIDSWADYTIGTSLELASGESVQFRAKEGSAGTFSTDIENYYRINAYGEGNIKVSGNVQSLVDGTLNSTSVGDCTFACLFRGCSKLVDASDLVLPATTLAYRCYAMMFRSCFSLTKVPELPATEMEQECYLEMFAACSHLTEAPVLPATTLAFGCYAGMFSECARMTTAPVLPAKELKDACYMDMFKLCNKLNYVKALFTTTPSSRYTDGWLYGVAYEGTFVKSKDATWELTGDDGIPDGWIVEVE